jgi:hypothetical protein
MRRALEKSSGADLPCLTLPRLRAPEADDSGNVRSEKILAIFDLCRFEYVEEIPRSIETASQTDNGR